MDLFRAIQPTIHLAIFASHSGQLQLQAAICCNQSLHKYAGRWGSRAPRGVPTNPRAAFSLTTNQESARNRWWKLWLMTAVLRCDWSWLHVEPADRARGVTRPQPLTTPEISLFITTTTVSSGSRDRPVQTRHDNLYIKDNEGGLLSWPIFHWTARRNLSWRYFVFYPPYLRRLPAMVINLNYILG